MKWCWLLPCLLWAGRAEAWTWEEAPAADLPAPVYGVDVVPHQNGKPMVLALGGQVTWLVDPLTGEETATMPVGARDTALVDVDGDGLEDLVLCGPAGLQFVRWEGYFKGTVQRLETRRCEAVEVVDSVDGPILAAGGEDVRLYDLPGNGLLALREVLDLGLVGAPLLVAEGELLAVSSVGAQEILEWSPHGRSTLAAGGRVGGLALGPWGWTWTLTDQALLADMTHRTVPLDPQPGPISSGDLDQDGQRDLVVLHADGLATVLLGAGGSWERLSWDHRITSVAMLDVDSDGCGDIVLGREDPPGVTVLRTTDCSVLPLAIPEPVFTPDLPPPSAVVGSDPDLANRKVAPPLDPSWVPPPPIERPPQVLGIQLPWFLGENVARESEKRPVQQYVVVGSGWAMGGALRSVYLQIPFFPALSVEMELGGPHIRWFIGGDSAALFLWMADEGNGIHLANLTTGLTFGSPRLRTGPFATGGLVNFGAGWRTVFTPWDDGDTFRGIELRLTWFYPYTGEVMVLYVWSQPSKDRRKRRQRREVEQVQPPPPAAVPIPVESPAVAEVEPVEAPTSDAEEPVAEGEGSVHPAGKGEVTEVAVHRPIAPRATKERKAPALLACSQFGISIGMAGGGSSTRYSWEYVGSEVPISPSFSPVIALQCETGGKGIGLLFGAESAPFYSYLTKDDERLHQMGSHTFGVMLGGKGFRVGPTATAGIWTLGGGLRAAIKIKEDRQGLIHQLDIRAMAHYPSAPAGQLMILYGIAFDPWK